MYDLLKTLVAFLVQPLPVTLMGLLVAGTLALVGHQKLSRWLSTVVLLFLFLASWAPVSETLLRPLEQAHPEFMPENGYDGIQAIVVLGGGWSPQVAGSPVARLGDSSVRRLMEGVRLWHELRETRLIVSGTSRRRSEPSNALGYSDAARALGVPESAIIMLERPTDTGQEARAVADYLGDGARVLLVTSASHMPRSMRHFEAAGLNPISAPTHYLTGHVHAGQLAYWVPSATHLRKSERLIHEWLGLIALRWE